MNGYTIDKGSVRAGNMWKRLTGGVSGLCIVPDEVQWHMRIAMPECPVGTHMKLCGLVYLTRTFKRIKRGGWHEMLSFSHENSDRVMATKTDAGIKLRTYTYRNGYGPATEMKDGLSFSDIGTVKEAHDFVLTLRTDQPTPTWIFRTEHGVSPQTGRNKDILVHIPNPNPTPDLWFGHYTFAYAGGHKQPAAPGDIHIACERTSSNY